MGMPVPIHVHAEIAFGLAVGRPVIIGQVEMGNAIVKGRAQDTLLNAEGGNIAKVVPQAQRDGRQLLAAGAAAAVFPLLIAIVWREIVHHFQRLLLLNEYVPGLCASVLFRNGR